MYLIKCDGEATAVTNSFDSAASYADGIRQPGHCITIVTVQPDQWSDVFRALERRASPRPDAWMSDPRLWEGVTGC